MPQLIFKGVKREDVIKLSKSLPSVLSDIATTPIDYFTFERPNTEYFFDGNEFEMYPLIEIIQFDRGRDVEKRMSETVQEHLLTLGYLECEVYFTHISEEDYYVR